MHPFDAIYIINLTTRTDRRREMIDQLALAGLDPASQKIHFFDAIRPDDAGGFPTLGTRGCFLSHLGVLKATLAAGNRRTLVLEDDVDFVRDFQVAFGRALPRLEADDWGMAYLGVLSITPPLLPDGAPVTVVPPASAVQGAHMFAVKLDVLPSLVAYLEAMLRRPPGDPAGGPMHVDGAYGWFRQAHPQMTTVTCTPVLGVQRPSRTDIHALRWFDRVPMVRDVVQRLRRLRAAGA